MIKRTPQHGCPALHLHSALLHCKCPRGGSWCSRGNNCNIVPFIVSCVPRRLLQTHASPARLHLGRMRKLHEDAEAMQAHPTARLRNNAQHTLGRVLAHTSVTSAAASPSPGCCCCCCCWPPSTCATSVSHSPAGGSSALSCSCTVAGLWPALAGCAMKYALARPVTRAMPFKSALEGSDRTQIFVRRVRCSATSAQDASTDATRPIDSDCCVTLRTWPSSMASQHKLLSGFSTPQSAS